MAWHLGRVAAGFGVVIGAGLAQAAPADEEFGEAANLYRAERMSAAYARFVVLANRGDRDAARIALFMHRYGPTLYGRYWDAQVDEVELWTRLAQQPQGRTPPAYRPPRQH